MARFPAVIAVAPLGIGSGSSYSRMGRGTMTNDIVETGMNIGKLTRLKGIDRVIVLDSFALGNGSAEDAFDAATAVDADLIVFYTANSGSVYHGTWCPGLGVITLGAFPNEYRRTYASASAMVIDVKTGYFYGAVGARGTSLALANGWTGYEIDPGVEHRAKRDALQGLIDKFPSAWNLIVSRYSTPDSDDSTIVQTTMLDTP